MQNPNSYLKQKERSLLRKLELIKEKGGKCKICGYDKNIAALEFHHIDPSKKSFQLDSRHLSNTTTEKLIEEANKCILVCANCHRELHNKQFEKTELQNTLDNITSRHISLKENKNKTGTCKYCGKEFPYVKGKIYCSAECRELDKHYPSYEEIISDYKKLKSWEKVAQKYNISRKVIQRIRKFKQSQA